MLISGTSFIKKLMNVAYTVLEVTVTSGATIDIYLFLRDHIFEDVGKSQLVIKLYNLFRYSQLIIKIT